MRLHVYAIMRDEERILPFFLRYYTTVAERIFLFDGGSVDKSIEIAKACPKVTLQQYPGEAGICDDDFLLFAESESQKSAGKADWTAWVDCDEFLYHPKLLSLLRLYKEKGVEVPKTSGFQMFSERFPTGRGQIFDEIKMGVPSVSYSKPEIFQSHIRMRWGRGCGRHSLDEGFNPVRSSTAAIKMLHYRYLEHSWVKNRRLLNFSRVPARCRANGHGRAYTPEYTGPGSYAWYVNVLKSGTIRRVI